MEELVVRINWKVRLQETPGLSSELYWFAKPVYDCVARIIILAPWEWLDTNFGENISIQGQMHKCGIFKYLIAALGNLCAFNVEITAVAKIKF